MIKLNNELYKKTIIELKAHFMVNGHGDGQAIKREWVQRYINIYPLKLEGVLLYLDGILIETDAMKIKVGNNLEVSGRFYDSTPDEAVNIATSVLHQLSLAFPLYQTRIWVKARDKFDTERVFAALEHLDTDTFI